MPRTATTPQLPPRRPSAHQLSAHASAHDSAPSRSGPPPAAEAGTALTQAAAAVRQDSEAALSEGRQEHAVDPPVLQEALRSYRLRPDAEASVLDEQTLRLRRPGIALRLNAPGMAAASVLQALRRGIPAAEAPDAVQQLWRHRLVDLYPTGEDQVRMHLAGVRIDGLGEVGTSLAEQLAEAGLGTLVVQDSQLAGADGLPGVSGTLGREDSRHTGKPRAEAVREALSRRHPETAVFECPPDGRVHGADLHVLCQPLQTRSPSADISALHAAAALSPAVLPISLMSEGALIGPLLAPTRGLCLQCWQLHLADDARRPSHSEDGEESEEGDGAEDDGAAVEPENTPSAGASTQPRLAPGVASIVAALTARQIQVLLTGRVRPAMADHVLRVDSDGRVTEQPIGRHPECTCRMASDRHRAAEEPPPPAPGAAPEPVSAPESSPQLRSESPPESPPESPSGPDSEASSAPLSEPSPP